MRKNVSTRTYLAIGALSLVTLIGGTIQQSFSAPAPAASPFGNLQPMAPVAAPAAAPRLAPTAPAAGPTVGQAAAAAAAAGGAPAAAPAAAGAAPQPRIIVIDRGLIMQTSAAGKEMVNQTQALSRAAEAQFRTEETALQTEATTLQQQMAILAADARAQKEKDFTAKQQAFQNRVQERQAEIQAGFNKAAGQLEVALGPILQAIMRERGANMVLDRSAVILAAIDVDVTNIAVQRLDRALPHVTVTLTKPPAGATAAAAPVRR